MNAIVVGPKGPHLAMVERPSPLPNEILVEVRAAGINRADLHVAAGHQHGRSGGEGTVIGMEWSGRVAAIGKEVPEGFAVGDSVMCSGTGAYAQYAVADWGRVYKLPSDTMSFAHAAALPIALQTSHEALTASGALASGEAVLVQGASSSVGLMCLQVARQMGAGLVIGTSTTPERRDRLAQFGAGLAVDSRDSLWPSQVLAATGGQGVDLLIDFLAGPLMNANMLATKVCGRIVNVGRMAGFRAEFDFDLHSLRRIRYTGVTFRTRSLGEVREIARRMKLDLWTALQAGQLALPVCRSFALEDAAAALDFVRANGHFGKVVLET